MFGRGLGLEQWNAFDLSPAESGGPESGVTTSLFFPPPKLEYGIDVRAPTFMSVAVHNA